MRVLVIREKPGESSVIANEQRSISSSLSLVEVDVYVYVYTAMRLSYFHEIGAATGRRCSAFQPVFTGYKLLEIERCLKANIVTASKRRHIPPIGHVARMVLAPLRERAEAAAVLEPLHRAGGFPTVGRASAGAPWLFRVPL